MIFGRSKGAAMGWGVSVALHASVIGAGSLLVWSIDRAEEEAYATEATTIVFDAPGLAPEPIASERTETATDSALDRLFEESAVAETMTPELFEAPELTTPPSVPERTTEAPPVEASPSVVREAEFFGTGASDARRIVYVVDASGSSVAIFPAVARELARSLDALNATQHATVIAAYGRPATDGAPARGEVLRATDELVRATPRRARELASWFENEVRPSGRSDLALALREAMALEPDAVFLLAIPGSASASRVGFLEELDAINPVSGRTGRRRAMIGVVSVGPPAVGDPLLEVARVHGNGAPLVVRERSELLQGD